MAPDDLHVKIAQVDQRLESLASTMARIDSAVAEIVQLDRNFIRLSAIQSQHEETIKTQWKRIDENAKGLLETNREVASWINKGKGVISIVLLLGTVFGALVSSSIGWVFTHLRDIETQVTIISQKISK